MREDLIQRQLELEEESVALGVKRYREQIENTPLSEMPPGVALMYRTIEPFAKAIKDFVETNRRGGGRMHQARAFLSEFDYYDVAYITARELINSIGSVRNVQSVARTLFKRLADHYEYLKMVEEAPAYLDKVEESQNKRASSPHHRRTALMYLKRKVLGIEDTDWSGVDEVHIGSKIIDLFIESTGLIERVQDSNSQWLIQGHEKAVEWIVKYNAKYELLSPVFLPMVVPPVDWHTIYGGGFLNNTKTLKLKLIKTYNEDALKALEEHDMPLVYSAINHLQKVPWRINKKVLEVLQEVHRLDNGLAGLPRMEEIPLPPPVWESDEEFEYLKQTQPEVIKNWKAQARDVYERRIQEKSKLMALVHKLWVAEKFKDEEAIYYVWTLDWRGRLYPVQPYLNPQGDDVAKSLLEFAEGKPLGERGAYWLKVHLANCYGVDKVSFNDRVAWVEEHHELILDSAKNPLDGQRFWAEADDPWQFLAGCFEYAGYCEEGYDFVSHLPIAMDGSCNGLQNFSAMLLDEVGGKATNLVPMDKPQDVYTEVLKVVQRKVEWDAENLKDEEQRNYAKLWVGKIDRNIVKRPVMTLPYGVKLFGIKDQIVDELKKREMGYLDCEDPYPPSLYLAKVLWESIGEVVIASRNAMDWLQEVARAVGNAESGDGALKWVTPAGFLVYQRYAKTETKTIRTFWGKAKVRVQLSVSELTDKLDKHKQRNGISPNFVHSMDASHLMLTINKLKELGITSFTSIHDSYGTHACDTDTLHRALREAFIEQYSQDVLQDFKEQVEAQYEGLKLPEVPPKGRLNLEAVKESLYFFA